MFRGLASCSALLAHEDLEAAGHLRFEPQRFAGHRMLEAQDCGVQREPVMRPIGMRGQVGSIAAVAENRVIRLGEVNANLIAAAGVELNAD